LTLDIVVLVIVGIVSLIGGMYFLMLYIVANVPYSFFVYRAFIVFSILLVCMQIMSLILKTMVFFYSTVCYVSCTNNQWRAIRWNSG